MVTWYNLFILKKYELERKLTLQPSALDKVIPCPPISSLCVWRGLLTLRLEVRIGHYLRAPLVGFHLFFTDDLTLFSRANLRNWTIIINTLNKFNTNSEWKINHSKSKVFFSKNCSPENVVYLILKHAMLWKVLGLP